MGGQIHSHAVRDISFSPTDMKFVTCSDDHGLKVFDFDRVIVLLTVIIIIMTFIMIMMMMMMIIIIIIINTVLSLLELGRHQHRSKA
jgi:WD40 repeat protein